MSERPKPSFSDKEIERTYNAFGVSQSLPENKEHLAAASDVLQSGIIFLDGKESVSTTDQLTVLTPKMQKALSIYGTENETFGAMLHRLYINEQLNIVAIAKQLKISNPTAAAWLRMHDIPLRSQSEARRLQWQDPQMRDKVSSSQRKRWRLKRESLLSRIFSPEANRKRVASVKAGIKKIEGTGNHPKERGRKTMIKNASQAFGPNPKERLNTLVNDQRLSDGEIGKLVHRNPTTIARWEKTLGVVREQKVRRGQPDKAKATIVNTNFSRMSELNERERDIITARYISQPLQTLEAIAIDFGICRERARQIETRALRKLSGEHRDRRKDRRIKKQKTQ